MSKAICAALAENGYDTERNVGHSQYRIDIGVVDPDSPDRYLLGILLDGSTYRDSKTARDRELAQISVLNSLGWRIARVWSMDWWDNSRKEMARLLDMLAKVSEQSRAAAEQAEEEQAESVTEPEAENGTEAAAPAEAEEKAVLPAEEEYEIIPDDPDPIVSANVVPYKAAGLKSMTLTADDFVQPACKKMIKDAIRAVIETEAPVSEARLSRRVIQSFGITRSTAKIQSHLSQIIDSLELQSTIQYEDRFIWNKQQIPDEYRLIRANGEGESKRDVKEIPVQETTNAVCLVLKEQISMSHDDLVRESARLMNFTRVTANVSAAFDAAIQNADARGFISTDENGNYKLSGSGDEYADLFSE